MPLAVLFLRFLALRTIGTRRSETQKPPCQRQKILRLGEGTDKAVLYLCFFALRTMGTRRQKRKSRLVKDRKSCVLKCRKSNNRLSGKLEKHKRISIRELNI